MMMSNRRECPVSAMSFGDRHSQREMHGDRQGVFRNDQVDVEAVQELVQLVLEEILLSMKRIRQETASLLGAEKRAGERVSGRMPEKCLGNEHARLRVPVQLPGEPVYLVPELPHARGPFLRLE